ncbi:ribonuclease P protein component [bacterium]|nr:ribonuclease P protein component [bacterium]
MLKRKYRLTNNSAFKATYRLKNSYYKSGIILWVGKEKTEEYPTRAAFVVSKKTHKRAVRRNRLKRLMREAYRLILKNNSVPKSQKYMSLIFIGQEKALDKDFKEIQSVVYELLNGIKE